LKIVFDDSKIYFISLLSSLLWILSSALGFFEMSLGFIWIYFFIIIKATSRSHFAFASNLKLEKWFEKYDLFKTLVFKGLIQTDIDRIFYIIRWFIGLFVIANINKSWPWQLFLTFVNHQSPIRKISNKIFDVFTCKIPIFQRIKKNSSFHKKRVWKHLLLPSHVTHHQICFNALKGELFTRKNFDLFVTYLTEKHEITIIKNTKWWHHIFITS